MKPKQKRASFLCNAFRNSLANSFRIIAEVWLNCKVQLIAILTFFFQNKRFWQILLRANELIINDCFAMYKTLIKCIHESCRIKWTIFACIESILYEKDFRLGKAPIFSAIWLDLWFNLAGLINICWKSTRLCVHSIYCRTLSVYRRTGSIYCHSNSIYRRVFRYTVALFRFT